MTSARLYAIAFLFVISVSVVGGVTSAQETRYPKPTELPNPYRLVERWPTLPKSMNGGQWGEVIRVHVDVKGNVWVFHRCFNIVPAGSATCINRGPANPPILEFDPSGKLLKGFGAGLFAYNHGFTMDDTGNLWVTDVNEPRSNTAASLFLDILGRGRRMDDYGFRSAEISIAGSLSTMNSSFVMSKTRVDGSPLLQRLLIELDDEALVKRLFINTLSRWPSEDEKQAALKRRSFDRRRWAEQLQWALINKVEFLLNY